MKALFTHLLSADEDTFDKELYGFLCMGPPARDAALSWLCSSDPLHRERACRVLAEVQDRPRRKLECGWEVDHTPIPYLIRVLENDLDSDVRCAAARALRFHGLPQTIPPLLRAARTNDPDICFWAAKALGSFHIYPKELHPLIPEARQLMLRLLNSPDEETRDWAANSAQCEAFNTSASNEILLRLTWDSNRFVRGEAVSALAHHRVLRAVPRIRWALHDSETVLGDWFFEGVLKLQAMELIPDLVAYGSEEARETATTLQKNDLQRRASGVAPTV